MVVIVGTEQEKDQDSHPSNHDLINIKLQPENCIIMWNEVRDEPFLFSCPLLELSLPDISIRFSLIAVTNHIHIECRRRIEILHIQMACVGQQRSESGFRCYPVLLVKSKNGRC